MKKKKLTKAKIYKIKKPLGRKHAVVERELENQIQTYFSMLRGALQVIDETHSRLSLPVQEKRFSREFPKLFRVEMHKALVTFENFLFDAETISFQVLNYTSLLEKIESEHRAENDGRRKRTA